MAGYSRLRNAKPVGTLEQLAKAGLDPAIHASCSEPKETDRGVENQGCANWYGCPWKDRHNVAVRIIKPSENGRRRIRENWMSCSDYLSGPKRQHGHNGVIVEVFGGEGTKVTLRGSVRQEPATPGAMPTFKPKFWKEAVPPIMTPLNNPDLIEEAAAVEIVKSAQEHEATERRNEALGIVETKVGHSEADAAANPASPR